MTSVSLFGKCIMSADKAVSFFQFIQKQLLPEPKNRFIIVGKRILKSFGNPRTFERRSRIQTRIGDQIFFANRLIDRNPATLRNMNKTEPVLRQIGRASCRAGVRSAVLAVS